MAEGDNLKRKLKKFTTVFNKILECPICLDTVKVPFSQCATGHVMCCDCMKALVSCPTCQEPFTTENHIIVKNLLEALPRLCHYSGDGCEQIVEPGEDHEAFCGYRPVRCRHPDCTDTKLLCQLLKHYDVDHPTVYVIKSIEDELVYSEFNPETPRKGSNLVFLFNQLFWFHLENEIVGKQLKLSFQSIPNGEMINDYYVRVTLENNNYVYTYTMKASVLGVDNEEQEDSGEDQQLIHYMKVPQSVLHHLVDEEEYLTFELFFFEAAK